jgi:hypothetical protein
MNAILFTKQIGALDIIIERKMYYRGGTAALNESVGPDSRHFILPSPDTIRLLGKDNARVAVANGVTLVKKGDADYVLHETLLNNGTGVDYYYEYENIKTYSYSTWEALYPYSVEDVYAKKNDHYIK